MFEYLRLKTERNDFLQSKYNYYKKFNMYGIGIFCFAFIILFVTDINILKSQIILSLGIRLLVIIPYSLLFFAYKKIKSYKVMSFLSHFVAHAIIGTSIWVVLILPDQAAATANFLFMGFLLLIVSFCTPISYTIVSQWILIGEIYGANSIYHFHSFELLLTYIIQIIIMLNIVGILVTKLYYDDYHKSIKLDFMTYHDQLTQVYNRNKLNQLVNNDNSLSCISDKICILMIDIDHFKEVNDTYGHDSGDIILKEIAQILKTNIRNSDYVIRWGGEEFLILLINCGIDSCGTIAEQIRSRVETSQNDICKITVSIGVSLYAGGDYTKSIKEADIALYQAKENGRNQVRISKKAEI